MRAADFFVRLIIHLHAGFVPLQTSSAGLCEPIEGTSQARLAQCLGLDASRFVGIGARVGGIAGRDDVYVPRYTMRDEERFRGCEPVMMSCTFCNAVSRFVGPYSEPPAPPPAGSTALGPSETLSFGLICSQLGCGGVMIPISVGGYPALQGGGKAGDAILTTPNIPAGLPMLVVARTRLVNLVTLAIRARVAAYMQVGVSLLCFGQVRSGPLRGIVHAEQFIFWLVVCDGEGFAVTRSMSVILFALYVFVCLSYRTGVRRVRRPHVRSYNSECHASTRRIRMHPSQLPRPRLPCSRFCVTAPVAGIPKQYVVTRSSL